MMKVIIYTRPDGRVSIVYLAWQVKRTDESEVEFIARVQSRAVPADATSVEVVEDSQIPTDRTFRNAWRAGAGRIECDIAVAKNIARDMLRDERRERFKVLDGLWMRAMGRGEALIAAEIEAKRETLRNWPTDPRIADCATADDLKALTQTMKSEVS
jgi:hypothetical protein